MKKIFLILTLLSLGVSKAQVVGGYLPLNSSKSATIGTVRTNSLVVTAPTISVNNKTLTAGNTGTVAVLSDVPLSILNQGLSINPADGVVYYMGTIPYTWQQLQGNGRYYLDANYTLTGATINFYTNGTLGSSETVTIAIGVDNSFTNISTALTMTAISTYTNVTGLSQNINSGSYIETRITCPTWVTNPTSVGFSIVYNFRRRS